MSRICIVQPTLNVVSETFIQAHGEKLPGVAGIVHRRKGTPWLGDGPAMSELLVPRALRSLKRRLLRRPWLNRDEVAYDEALRKCRPDVVLAEYGPTGVEIGGACRRANAPLVVHFHGYDASRRDVLERHSDSYRQMFSQAAAIIGVSRAMERQLLSAGCPQEKLVYNPYGIDCDRFYGAAPAETEATLVAVGRFVEKKAPYLTLVAFAQVLRGWPAARLRMIGDGPLLHVCRDLVRALEIESAVTFLGSQPHDVVQREMRKARAFVQHSIVASDGDSEGTPVAVLEAGATGLPVIATRHAGIPDVVVDGETGLLVDEHDVAAMAEHMLTLARNPALADQLGRNAAAHVRKYYTMEHSLRRLARVLEAAARREDLGAVRSELADELGRCFGAAALTTRSGARGDA